MKNRVFVGSTKEGLHLAEAIQSYFLDIENIEITIWTQNIFEFSKSNLENLENSLPKFDFGIFIFTPDDIAIIREVKHRVARDNVILEFGLFAGHLGRNHTFFLTPASVKNLHLPTDLLGISPGKYEDTRNDENWDAAVTPFCGSVKKMINTIGEDHVGISEAGMFEDFATHYNELFRNSKSVELYFIHARGWREFNHSILEAFLNRNDSKSITVYLPDYLNSDLINALEKNFSDGRYILGLIKDAAEFYLGLKETHGKKMRIKISDFFPTYSFYKFDNRAVMAMYPTTDRKKNVPALLVHNDSKYWKFLTDDIAVLKNKSKIITPSHISLLTN